MRKTESSDTSSRERTGMYVPCVSLPPNSLGLLSPWRFKIASSVIVGPFSPILQVRRNEDVVHVVASSLASASLPPTSKPSELDPC